MILYKHFALPNLYLSNGFTECETEDGVVREYEREDELEECIRRVLLRNPKPLRGWDLRFLRNGLNITQAAFGQLVDRDAQTIARWEKSDEPIPKYADTLVRIRYAEKFEPELSIKEVLGYSDGTGASLPHKVVFTLTEHGWTYNLGLTRSLPGIHVRTRTTAQLSATLPRVYRVFVGQKFVEQSYELEGFHENVHYMEAAESPTTSLVRTTAGISGYSSVFDSPTTNYVQ